MPIARIRVQNPVLSDRHSTFQCNVTFPRSAVRDLSLLTVVGAEGCDIAAFGLKWPDGSHRFATVTARVAMQSGETKSFDVDVGVRPESDVGMAPESPLTFIPIGKDGSIEKAPLTFGTARFSTKLTHQWGRLTASWHSMADEHQPVVHWRLTVNYSEPQTRDLSIVLQEPIAISLPWAAGFLVVNNGEQKGVTVAAQGEWFVTTFLPAGTTIAHGQSHGWQGVYVGDPILFEAEKKALVAVCEDWCAVGVGPDEAKLTFPAWMPSYSHVRSACERQVRNRLRFPKKDPYFDPFYGLGKTTSETGAQDDFGVMHGHAGLLGSPEWLDIAVTDALQEWCRPCHFRETDGSPVTAARHPQLNRWMGRPHENGPAISPDQLGKPHWGSLSSAQQTDFVAKAHGWFPAMDPQHSSLNLLFTTAMMTGDPQLMDLVHDYAEEYLSSYTLPSTHPHHFSSGMDAARAVGRTGETSAWCYLLTGREDLRTRMLGRVAQVVAPAWGKTAGRQVRPLDITSRVNLQPHSPWPTYQVAGQPVPSPQPREWHPWQEGIAAHGLYAVYGATGDPLALQVALGVAENCLAHGWQDRSPFWQVAKAVEYTGVLINGNSAIQDTGEPVPTTEDHDTFISGDGTDYRYWAGWMVKWLATAATTPELKAKAQAIVATLQRTPPSDGFFGLADKWLAE